MRIFLPVISFLLLQTFHWVAPHRGSRAGKSDCEGPSRNRRHGPPARHVYDHSHRIEYSPSEMQADQPVNRLSTAPRTQNCSTACQMRDKLKEYKLDLIKQDILRKLRLTKPPNRTMANIPRIPGQMKHIFDKFGITEEFGMYNDQPQSPVGELGDDYHATTSFVFNFGRSPPEHKRNPHYSPEKVVYFDLRSEAVRSSLERATLGLYVRRPDPNAHQNNDTVFLIDKILSVTDNKSCRFKYKKIKHSRRRLATDKFYQFDVTQMVRNWIESPDKNFGLKVESDTLHDGKPMVITNPAAGQDDQIPYLELELRERGNSRTKRNLVNLDCHNDSTEKRCCRYKLEVDFEQFEWDWIIAPKRYQAYFCSGDCEFTFMQRFPHSHLLQQVHGPNGVGGPCCAPGKMSPISMLYFDDHNNIVYGTLPGMVVDRCGCS